MLKSYPWKQAGALATALAAFASPAFAGEADIKIPEQIKTITFFDGALTGMNVLMIGLAVCVVATIYGWMQYLQIR